MYRRLLKSQCNLPTHFSGTLDLVASSFDAASGMLAGGAVSHKYSGRPFPYQAFGRTPSLSLCPEQKNFYTDFQ